MRRLPKHIRNLWLLGALLASAVPVVGMAQALDVREQALDFTLPSTTGEQISLSQFQGKKLVLLEFHIDDFGAN
jgi:peroxiredoxin